MSNVFNFDDDDHNNQHSVPVSVSSLPQQQQQQQQPPTSFAPGGGSHSLSSDPYTNNNNDTHHHQQQQQQQQSIEGGSNSSSPFGGALQQTQAQLMAMLDSQASIVCFVLFVIFAFIVASAVDWTAAFPLFAIAIRIVIHAVVSIWRWQHGDVACAALGVLITGLVLPFLHISAVGAGIAAYVLLVVPQYAEEAIVTGESQQNAATISRKRGVQFVALFAPVSLGMFVFFQLRGGLLFHLVALLVAIVFMLSYVLRAMRLPVGDGFGTTSGAQTVNNNNNNNYGDNMNSINNGNNNNNNNTSIPAFNSGGLHMVNRPVAPPVVPGGDQEMTDPNDPFGVVISRAHTYKAAVEEKLRGTPAAYQAYLYAHRPYTTAACALLLSLLLVVNVATDVPLPSDNVSSSPSSSAAPSSAAPATPVPNIVGAAAGAVAGSSFLSSRFGAAAASITSNAASHSTTSAAAGGDGDAAGSSKSAQQQQHGGPVFWSEHHYISIGLVSAFLIFSIELMAFALFDVKDAPYPSGKVSAAFFNPRYRRLALLGFAFLLAFFPASWYLYPASLAIAAIVPWLVLRDASTASQVNESSNQASHDAAAEIIIPPETRPSATAAADEDSGASGQRVPVHVELSAAAAGNRTSNSVLDDGAIGRSTREPINEQVVTDFWLPTLLTGLLLVLIGAQTSTSGLATFSDFLAIAVHGAMAYMAFKITRSLTAAAVQRQRGGDDNGNL